MAQNGDFGHFDAWKVEPGHGNAFHPHAIPDAEVVAGRFEVQMRACGFVLHENGPATLDKADGGLELDGEFFQTALVEQRADFESSREHALSGGLGKQQAGEAKQSAAGDHDLEAIRQPSPVASVFSITFG